jgi:hypothetical protein
LCFQLGPSTVNSSWITLPRKSACEIEISIRATVDCEWMTSNSEVIPM